MKKQLMAAVAAAACLQAPPAYCEEIPMKYLATIGGRCESFLIDGEPQTGCKDVVFNIAYKTNRVTFIFFIGRERGFAFSGSKDEQPAPGLYRLTLTNLNIEQKQIGAEGSCEIRGDVTTGSDIVCEAKTSTEPQTSYKVSFKSIGKPDLKKFD